MNKLHSEIRAWEWQGDGSCVSWDGLRRDDQLWVTDGDCDVFLYDEGQSRRGPSIRIPYHLLHELECTSLTVFATSEYHEASHESSPMTRLFLGAPSDLSREEAFHWHITTRNFFAWLLGKPLVGPSLGKAMTDLLGRMAIYRESSADNVGDLLDFTEHIGYSDLSGRPDLALAMLSFADEYKLSETWVDAFAHCVGMREDLSQSSEYETTKNVNKALITRAALQMDLHLERATRAIDNLLEEDLSSENINLPTGSRLHLDHFRSFLQSHFVGCYGYWPPREESFSKALYTSMKDEFHRLYDYLADKDYTRSDGSVASGLRAKQVIETLDTRHSFTPLPYALPLLPDINTGAGHRTQAHWALRNWKLGSKDHKQSATEIVRNSYLRASNRTDTTVMDSDLVQAYIRFESELSKSFDDKLSFGDARKTRWVMVYQMLQRLISITRAPEEVKDKDSAPYPLCCPMTNLPPWRVASPITRNSVLGGISTTHNEPDQSSIPAHQSNYRKSQPLARAGSLRGALPEKSKRRSLMWDNSIPNPPEDGDMPSALSIPMRSSSWKSLGSRSSSSDAVPSLHWSQGSTGSVSSSNGPNSPMSGSSSVYSNDEDELPEPIQKPEVGEKLERAEPLFTDLLADNGAFIYPGLMH